MKEVKLKIPDKEYYFFMKLINNLGFIEVEKVEDEDSKEEITNNLREGFKEMKLIREGKKEGTPLKDFLDEL